HELTRDAAYGSILNRKRRELHRRVAETIEALFPEGISEHAHRLAVHYDIAGDPDRVLQYRLMAGENAAAMGAAADAAAHFSAAADAAERLTLPPEEVTAIRERSDEQSAIAAAMSVESLETPSVRMWPPA